MNLLVHAPNWVGDHAMAFPFYAALRETFPQARLVLLGRAWVSDLAPPWFDEIVTLEGKNIRQADVLRLRKIHFDYAFTLSPSFRSAWLLFRLKTRVRIGFASDFRSPLLNFGAPYNRFEHRAYAYIRLLKPFDAPQRLWARHVDVKLRPSAKPSVKADVVICPGSTAASKKYPVAQFIEVIERIAQKKPGVKFALLGAKIDEVECESIMHHFKSSQIKIQSLCAQTSLIEAHALIANAKLCIANDSGLGHITSLTDTPLVTWNGMGRRSETAPLASQKTIFDLNLACSPCFKRVCPRSDAPLACLTGITAKKVAAAALKYLRRG